MTHSIQANKIRNIAIIAHVDHGKTTLVDRLLHESGAMVLKSEERVMDSNDLERERGITILAKNTTIHWDEYTINLVDTPGHADFGGEVERVLSMVDSVLLVVDATEGPMPQTRFVTQKAFAHGLKPILVINKVDRDSARTDEVIEEVFDLFDRLGANEEQLDFPVIYASALSGYAKLTMEEKSDNMKPLLDLIVEKVPAPVLGDSNNLKMQIAQMDYSSYVGVIGIGRIYQGELTIGQAVNILGADGSQRRGKVGQILGYLGLERESISSASAGQIVAVSGLGELKISDTLTIEADMTPLLPLVVDEPSIEMIFQVNTSPFAGREGKFVTSRQLRDRLKQETLHNIALRVEDTESAERFRVCGRGELHLGILIEQMRREGFEMGLSRPQAILKRDEENPDKWLEPFEELVVDVETLYQGPVMEKLGQRRAEIKNMISQGDDRIRIEAIIPSRGLIGFQNEAMLVTSGSALVHHVFSHYAPMIDGKLAQRQQGVMIASATGKALGYSLFNLQERGRLMIGHAETVYEGMIIGLHSRENDLTVNCLKGKKLTNVRAAGTDENLLLEPPIRQSLEEALQFINDDELVEVTPTAIRLRKRYLTESERKRSHSIK